MRNTIVKVFNIDVDLLPCPWCQSDPEVFTEINDFMVACNNSHCPAVVKTLWKPKMDDVIQDWNNRS